METSTRLHPLLTAAALSVTVFSAVGVAALTGLVPPSISSQKQQTPIQEELALPAAQQLSNEIDLPEPVAAPPAPAKKAVAKKPVARVAAASKSVTPAVYRDYVAETRVALPGHLATVQAVREVKAPGQHTGLGPIAGGIAGAVLGDQIGKGKGTTRKVLTVLGAAGGAYAGREIEKQARATTHWEVDVRRDDGGYDTVRSDVAPPWQPGERVRVVDGRLQAA